MKISNDQLNDLVVEVARDSFGSSTFQRRRLMLAVEARVKAEGWWSVDDDAISTSVGTKTEGLAKIDWSISHLKERGRLLNVDRDRWKLPTSRNVS
jgi:hypothetical protein